MSSDGNQYHGHILSACIEQSEKLIGRKIDGKIFVDQGYRKHDCLNRADFYTPFNKSS